MAASPNEGKSSSETEAFSRRSMLRTGGGLAATAALLGTGGVFAEPAAAAVPASQYFDITQPSYDLFRSKMLHESHHVMQSFAFDNVNRRLFIAQTQNGSSGDDLCLNQVDFSGNRIGSMHLNGAGHGVSIGVEAVGTASYIWMECDSDGTSSDGRGTALARFKFINGGTPAVTKFLAGSKTITWGSTLVFREPEGMAIYRTAAGETRLFLGFGSRSSLDNINRYANIFYKNVLVG